METNEIDYNELARDARKEINNEFDRLNEKAERLKEYQLLLDGLEALMAANEKQREEIESLQQQLADEKRQREELDMKNKELNKLSTDVAKKSGGRADQGAAYLRQQLEAQASRQTGAGKRGGFGYGASKQTDPA